MSDAPLVRLGGVSKAFGDQVILDGLDLELPRGTTTVLMGLSGTGKSVTLKLIAGLLEPDAGEIEVCGIRLDGRRKTLREVREHLGFLFQSGALVNWLTVADNLALPLLERGVSREEADRTVERRLTEVGLADAADKLPSALSGGMRKRVAFARALIGEPDLILYDEPTTGLDPITKRVVDDLIIHGRDDLGTTGLVVSHDVASTLRIADRIALLHESRADTVLTPDEFLASDHPLATRFLSGDRLPAAEELRARNVRASRPPGEKKS